ncbi:adenylate kinase 7a [Genypterus blacodes]|uniref:adenylate kinase 7a n=1 Tax=Genypterus blacodes TaxID=154954 RepID=UPI003F777FEA
MREIQPKRVFISDVDSYSSGNIAKFLSTRKPGELDEDFDESEILNPGEPAFHIVGTVSSSSKSGQPSFVLQQYHSPSRDELLQSLLECDVVLYNVSENTTQEQVEEAMWAVAVLRSSMETFINRKVFILISSLMTWAKVKPVDEEDVNVPLTEEDYKRRRPHPSYRNLNDLEKLVLKLRVLKRSKLKGYVVNTGLQYGKGENVFHCFFKTSWLMEFPKVPIFGEGTNHIPMIHIDDLAGVIHNVIELKPKSKYILAVDDSKNTLEEVVEAISAALGTGKTYNIPKEEVVNVKDLEPWQLEYLGIDLRLDALLLKDTFNLTWASEAGMIENIDKVVEEYRESRQLFPIRIYLTGPPSVGKTIVVKKICLHYQIHHVKLKEVIEEKITQLEMVCADESEDRNEKEVAAAEEKLEIIRKSMETNEGRLVDYLLFEILLEKLNSAPCRNQGFILDGFPKTFKQASVLYTDDDAVAEDVGSKAPLYNKAIIPEHVFVLDASDDVLLKRAQALPQDVAEELRHTEKELVARLAKYRQLRDTDESQLEYFDELEIHPEHIEINVNDPEYTEVMEEILEIVGSPKNYGLTPEEEEEQERRLEEALRLKLVMEAAERKRRREATLAEMTSQYEEWTRNLSLVKNQELELQEARALPLRSYLMEYVMPSLSEAMHDCSKVKPPDPVDFLAEHLLKNMRQD